ncbi:hypothetical protein [Methylomonas methanica]|nr:hypothetical protein [Methylomonas methanica]
MYTAAIEMPILWLRHTAKTGVEFIGPKAQGSAKLPTTCSNALYT